MDVIYHNFGTHGTNGESDKLERLLNNCIRYINNVGYREHINPHRVALGLMTLFDRRTVHVAGLIYKIINNGAPNYLTELIEINENNTRSQNKLMVQMQQNNFHRTSFKMGSPILWNLIPNEIRNEENSANFIKKLIEVTINKNVN